MLGTYIIGEFASVAADIAIVIGQLRFDATAARIAQYLLNFDEKHPSLIGLAVSVVLICREECLGARSQIDQKGITLLTKLFSNDVKASDQRIELAVDVSAPPPVSGARTFEQHFPTCQD